jgi:hypothetical protein
MRLPGTLNRKGDDLPDRPYRRSEMLAIAMRNQVTPPAALHAIAQRAPQFFTSGGAR